VREARKIPARYVTLAMLMTLVMATPGIATYICPPGRFVLEVDRSSGTGMRDDTELELGRGSVELHGVCPPARGRPYLPGLNAWLHVAATWPHCRARRGLALRARIDTGAQYCTRLTGALRGRGGARARFVAERIPACGNNLRERGERCDGTDSTGFGTCCTADCTVKPGCPVRCDQAYFPCTEPEVCTYQCGSGGVCQPRSAVDCGGGPVCGCDQATTYPDRCAAFAAGTGVSQVGACQAPAR
jgi:hypothetical protein